VPCIVITGTRPGERLNEILFAQEEPTVDIGVAGIVAARPNEPKLALLREWLATLDQALKAEQRDIVMAVLKDAVPEFKAGAVGQ